MKKIITTIIIFLTVTKLFAQSTSPPVDFKTPEVTAFDRYLETPVSKYTGVPDISIPLYEISIKGVKIPVTLTYHAGGIRVDQDATWVGLGWNLEFGGQITRKVRGVPDEYYYLNAGTTPAVGVNYFMQLPDTGPQPNSENEESRQERINAAKYGKADYMPDEFYYSVLGYSGKFMFSQLQNKFILFPQDDISVQKSATQTVKLNSWNLALPNGISVDLGNDGYTAQGSSVMNAPGIIRNSWQIKTVRNSYNDSISFTYDNSTYRMFKIYGQQYKVHTGALSESTTTVDNPLVYDCKIKLIQFPGGKMEFITQPRLDMPGTSLSTINVYDASGSLLKTISFNYSYFYGNTYEILSTVNPIAANTVSDDFKNKRLRLDSVNVTALNNQPSTYNFDYYTLAQMPSKYCFSQDHWGYFNGIANTGANSFIPSLYSEIAGGDRRVKTDKSNVFTLKSITYPEGGKKEFVYENNTAGLWNTPTDLLATYQDDNFIEQNAAIAVSSYSRNTSYPAPDQSSPGIRYFKKQFTVSGTGFPTFDNNWNVSTNFGISTLEQSTIYNGDNVNFTLERINADNSRTLIKSFNTTDTNFPYGSVTVRNGSDHTQIPISAGNYEMTVKMVYSNAVNSAADNQPYNLSFMIKWREMDPAKNMVNVGGLRIRDINYYDQNSSLVKKKSYTYTNPFADSSNPNFTSGRIVSFPQYIQNRLRAYHDTNDVLKTDWIANFTSNSVLPLETTAGSYAGYEYVDEYDVDTANPQNNLRTAYHFSFDQPYFGNFYPQRNTGMYESKEWSRGKLLYTQYYKNNSLIKSEDYTYNYWSPHLQNDTQEDYVEEINTDFVSFQALQISCQCIGDIYPDDFYDMDGGLDNCVYYYYTPFHNHVITNANRPILNWGSNPPISNTTCDYYTTVPYFKHYTAFDRLKTKTVSTYVSATSIIAEKENYNYEKTPVHYQQTKTIAYGSAGDSLVTTIKYPQDLSLTGSAETARLKLISNHQINTVLSQSRIKKSSTFTTTTDYKVDSLTSLVNPYVIKTNTAGGVNETRDVYQRYDSKGNVLSFSKANGLNICYVWSYNYQYPVAEIKNASYSLIESTLGKTNIANFANSNPSKAALDTFIAPLRSALPNAQLTLYAYKPFGGITSQTDPGGKTTYYEYDEFQRLKYIKDQNGNIIKQYSYHYKN